MTPVQAREFISKYPNALNYVKPSHLEELSPLHEVHIEAITVRKDEFHDLKGSFVPRKETLDKFAQAAGVAYNQTADTTRMEGNGCYVGTAQAMLIGPDGKYVLGPICEYEFDCDIRLEEMKLNEKADWSGVPDGGRPNMRAYTDKELAQERVQFRKVGRQRANTGARNRATLAALGMQTGFKNLFEKKAPNSATVVFLFSRIIVNAKNELVMNRMLDGIAGNVAQLYGPQSGSVTQIAAPSGQAEPYRGEDIPEGEPRNVTPSAAALAAEAEAWEDDPEPEAYADPRVKGLINSLLDYQASKMIPKQGMDAIEAALARKETNPIILQDLVNRSKAAYDKAEARRRGETA